MQHQSGRGVVHEGAGQVQHQSGRGVVHEGAGQVWHHSGSCMKSLSTCAVGTCMYLPDGVL